MTVPSERTRAIVNTRQFLEQLQNPRLSPDVPIAVREHARSLLRHYPCDMEIHFVHHALPEWFGAVVTGKNEPDAG